MFIPDEVSNSLLVHVTFSVHGPIITKLLNWLFNKLFCMFQSCFFFNSLVIFFALRRTREYEWCMHAHALIYIYTPTVVWAVGATLLPRPPYGGKEERLRPKPRGRPHALPEGKGQHFLRISAHSYSKHLLTPGRSLLSFFFYMHAVTSPLFLPFKSLPASNLYCQTPYLTSACSFVWCARIVQVVIHKLRELRERQIETKSQKKRIGRSEVRL